MQNHWLDQVKNRLQDEATAASDVAFDRLMALGLINDRGEVTGQLHRWNAFLAITQVKFVAGGGQIEAFRCLKPVFGMPGSALIDISRNSMVACLKEGKRIITATRDDRLGIWREGCNVRLSPGGFIRCESVGDGNDNVGNLPEFQQMTPRC
jgi:hypothetical protein